MFARALCSTETGSGAFRRLARPFFPTPPPQSKSPGRVSHIPCGLSPCLPRQASNPPRSPVCEPHQTPQQPPQSFGPTSARRNHHRPSHARMRRRVARSRIPSPHRSPRRVPIPSAAHTHHQAAAHSCVSRSASTAIASRSLIASTASGSAGYSSSNASPGSAEISASDEVPLLHFEGVQYKYLKHAPCVKVVPFRRHRQRPPARHG